MAFLNDHYLKLKAGYLFPEIGRRVKAFCEANLEAAKRLIRCGIGDVTEPLPPAVIAAMHKAVDEMGARDSFHGYGPEQGYEWLRAAISSTALCSAAMAAGGSGSVTSPMPQRMTRLAAAGFASQNAFTRRPISGKR